MMSIRDANPATVRQGDFLGSLMHSTQFCSAYNQLNVNFSFDSVRDSYYSTQTGTSVAEGMRLVSLPCSATAGSILYGTSKHEWMSPVITLIGGVPGGNYIIDYCANYETVPAVGASDLLDPVPGRVGSPELAVRTAGALANHAISSGDDFMSMLRGGFAKLAPLAFDALTRVGANALLAL